VISYGKYPNFPGDNTPDSCGGPGDPLPHLHPAQGASSGVGVRLKVGDKYWEDWRGGVWEGLCPPQLGGLPPENKSILRWKLCNSEQRLVLLSYITAESGGIIPQSWRWGIYPPVPPAPTPMGASTADQDTDHLLAPPMLKRNRRHVNQVPRYSYCSMCCILYDSTL